MKIEEKIKIVKLGKLKKHLGIMYDWKQDKLGNTYLEHNMEISMTNTPSKLETALYHSGRRMLNRMDL
jgi:hypothetical protein